MTLAPARPDLALARVLQPLFRRQAQEVLGRLDLDAPAPDVGHWTGPLAAASRPAVLRAWQEGMRRMARQLRHRRAPHGNRPGSPFAPAKSAGLGWNFDLVSPNVFRAVDGLVLQFCQATNDTATSELADALARLRDQMKRGLARSEAYTALAKRVRKIFADPMRAWRIAQTEGARALHAGGIMAAKESRQVEKKRWVCSSDACARCLALADKEVGLDEPFWVDPRGGAYAIVQHAPLHPSCMCDWAPVL
jgi:hypothetical protein